MDLIQLFQETRAKEWINEKPAGRELVTGLSGSAKSLAILSYYRAHLAPLVVVLPNLYQANALLDDLHQFLAEDELHFFPVDEVLAVEMSFASPEARSERIKALDFLASGDAGIVVTTLAGMKRFLPQREVWQNAHFAFKIGSTFALTELPQQLVLMGYRREALVASPGEFSLRGSILDIYPLTAEAPVRIEFFDDEVDSLRSFDPETQRSLDPLEHYEVNPATDKLVTQRDLAEAAKKMRNELEKLLPTLSKEEKKDAESYFGGIIGQWEEGLPSENDQLYLDYVYPDPQRLDQFALGTPPLFIDDYSRIQELERTLAEEEAEWITDQLAARRIFSTQRFSHSFHEIVRKRHQPQVFFSLFQKGMGNLKFNHVYAFQQKAMQQFFGQLPLFKTEADRWQKQQQTVVILVPTEERLAKVEEILREGGIQTVIAESGAITRGVTQLILGNLANGFEMTADKLVVVTEHEIFHTPTKRKKRRQHLSNAERLKNYSELKPGDYVVHVNHGIGRFLGMETLEVDGVHQDYITILYQNNDKLFIPVTQLDMVQKYVASEGKSPRVNKLGGSEWAKTKRKISGRIEDIADELVQLYAARESEKGFAFSKDDSLQAEFEAAFPYAETDDQLRSIAEIKKDMERERPMDRLLVGDVGYGKTEVALRAAFKAIQDNKQVAFLVPTTILAQQHYETMLERFDGFPVNVGILSRFRTNKQQKETLAALKKGQVDIVVGTHRLLSKDVKFQDLGLLIVDEEQRFGVKHKERLKQLKAQVDVLTLTATPIPRTLHMSMIGVRDLSVIETPPEDRYPVQTYVMERNPGAIREAIQRELARGGQIFYLYNRVETIERKVAEIEELVPDARVAYAHGQMSEGQLEGVLMEFIDGNYDVLVTTTIIETGIDMPNVNTLFVENADYMGLSTLYQLRGRVGRTNRVAYAYFMYEPLKILSEVSEKRLQAIKDFTELGSGFKIAMRDLSIRGAGTLLGAQQHGFIDAVGFDMYSQMLNEAIARKQGKNAQNEKTAVELNLGVDAYLPDDYISDQRQKIEFYKRIRQMDSPATLVEIQEDLVDRFGDYPPAVAELLTVGEIKMNGDRALLDAVDRRGPLLSIKLSRAGTKRFNVEEIFQALSATTLKASLATENEQMIITLRIPKTMKNADWLTELKKVVDSLQEIRAAKLAEKVQ
ncbi:MAG: transcription-repair coupling factor [Enterococcaceae bacterium]|jgi:transcription-repair coupling factor (superfamily II helicase)|nr:transcription-repair coupling factor [Enterococcaceae bacterium]MCI1919860.1 transcription-repair coupling factor [Enterococcaceae bacterium]